MTELIAEYVRTLLFNKGFGWYAFSNNREVQECSQLKAIEKPIFNFNAMSYYCQTSNRM